MSESKLKLILITVAVVLLVVLVVLIVVNIISGKGENTAESISEYIGVDVAKAQKSLICTLRTNRFSGSEQCTEF